MCTSLFAFGLQPSLLFFLAFNRDEFLDRLTAPLHWWEDFPGILAGRDLVRNGTWLGISRSGRFAFLTNFREPHFNTLEGSSRGDLPVDFLKGNQDPLQYLQSIDTKAYNGFNLVVGIIPSGPVAYLTNRGETEEPELLRPGLYGLSNGHLHSKWPKTERAKHETKELLEEARESKEGFPWNNFFEGVLDRKEKVVNLRELPETGMGSETEMALSSIFIEPWNFKGRPYGTRCKTVILGWSDGSVQVQEWSLSSTSTMKQEEFAIIPNAC